MSKLEQITTNETYKQVMSDSFGGIMYNVANRGKYDTSELLTIWDSMNASERESVGGIVKGAMHFLQESN
jgi:hypothetical protein